MITDFSYTLSETPEKAKPKILIVDDEEAICSFLSDLLSDEYECLIADSAKKAFNLLEKEDFALVLSDINLPDESGIQVAKRVRELYPETVVVVISGQGDFETAIEAMRIGAFDYVKKPFEIDNLSNSIRRAFEHHCFLVGRRDYEKHIIKLLEKRTEQIDHLFLYDSLTNLPNRILFEDRLTQAIEQAKHSKKIVATILISVKQLKQIYSNLGTKYGDAALIELVSRVKEQILSSTETLARFDHDLAILASFIEKEQKVIELIERIEQSLKNPIKVYDEEIALTINAGISIFPNDCNNAQEAIRNASAALEKAKEEGNTWLFFTSDLTQKSLNRLKMEVSLRRALENEEFELHFQPKVEIATRKIVGAEALIRWNSPKMGMILPTDFIPFAEETGLIIPIGDWVLRNTFRQCKIWAEKGKQLSVSVNLSAYQLNEKNFYEKVVSFIEETGVDPKLLEFEVTESVLLKNPELSAQTLKKLKNLGIKILIDDFGTGYSSFAYLKKLPLDGLKIDKSFLHDLSVADDQSGADFIVAIVTLAHNLRLKVVAEGVETEEQFNLLRLVKCDEAQGYLFGKPVLPEMFANFWK
ncbi:MAG: EAL domain-containing protein [Acidobacteriota bacterium]|nr:EAL domain-containing protein [Acidobacteriota bacterium]